MNESISTSFWHYLLHPVLIAFISGSWNFIFHLENSRVYWMLHSECMIWIADGFIPRYFPIKIYFFRFINLEVQSQQNEKFKNSQILTKKISDYEAEGFHVFSILSWFFHAKWDKGWVRILGWDRYTEICSNMYSAIFVFMFSTRCDAVTHNAVDTTVHNTTSSSYIPHDYIYANK